MAQIPADLPSRFEAKVDRRGPDECHPWLGSIGSHGYGQIAVDGVPQLAHRVAYELYIGPIPEGDQVDHVRERGCTLKHCVNERHLEAVTQQENIRRQIAAGQLDWRTGQRAAAAKRAALTHCKRGHPFNDENTGYRRSGHRYCRACRRYREAQR